MIEVRVSSEDLCQCISQDAAERLVHRKLQEAGIPYVYGKPDKSKGWLEQRADFKSTDYIYTWREHAPA